MAEKVELHSAFMWDCPDCGRENFARGVTVETTPEEAFAHAKDLGMDVDAQAFVSGMVGGEFMIAPDTVSCAYCRKEFEVEAEQ